MYTLRLRVRYSECDDTGHAGISNILDYLQDACNFQAESLGMGVEYQTQNQIAWILSSWQVDIQRYPRLGEQIKVSTWPYDFYSFYGLRNFQIVSDAHKEEVLVKANSVWVLMDMVKKRPVKLPPEMLERYVREPKLEMDYLDRKLPDFETNQAGEAVWVPRYFIDTNHHMNNARYVLLAERYLPQRVKANRIRAEYKKSAMLGELIYPKYTLGDHCLSVKLQDENGSTYAVVRMEVEPFEEIK